MMDRVAEVWGTFARVGRGLIPWRCLGGGELLGRLPAGRGKARHLLAVLVLRGNQALVVEQLDGRIDGTGARAPGPAAALANLLDHLVAVHRPVEEEEQGGRTDVAAASPRAPAHRRIGPEAHASAEAHAPASSARAAATAEASSQVVFEIVLFGSWIHRVLRSLRCSMQSRY